MSRVRFDLAALSGAMSKWRTKRRIAQEMQSLFPHKYTNSETPYRALRRAETGEFVDLNTALCIAAALKTPIDELLDAQVSVPGQEQAFPAAPASPAAGESPFPGAPPVDATPPEPTLSASRVPRLRRLIQVCVMVLALVALTLAALELRERVRVPVPERVASAGSAASGGAPTGGESPRRIGLIITGTTDLPTAGLSRRIGGHLPEGLSAFSGIERQAGEALLRLPARIGADGVAQVETRRRGRYLEVSLSYATAQHLEHLWIEALPRHQFAAGQDAMARRLADRLAAHLLPADTLPADAAAVPPTGSRIARAFDAYLRARILLDGSEASSLPTLNRANSLLQSALQGDPNLALAHAAQCETLASLFWVDDHRPYLRDARAACDRARALAPSHPYVTVALAARDTRDGRAEAALTQLATAVERHPDSTKLRLALAQAQFAVFERRGDRAALREAISQMRLAIEREPDYWSPHFWLGTFAYYQQDYDTALAALQRAVELHPAEITLANFGSVALCQDNLELARQAFEEIESRFPTNHLGPEKLGTINHFLGNYTREIAYRQRGIRLLGTAASPDIHQIFGALADAHRLQGTREEALRYYRRAASIIQRDAVREIARHQDPLALALYRARIDQLTGDSPEAPEESTLAGATPDSLGASGNVWAGQLFALLGRPAAAARHWAAAVESCPVYRRHPDNPRPDNIASSPASD